eukprot:1188745-Prorocentrum_minimum.AAC.5
MNEEQQAEYSQDFDKYFDVKDENRPGFTNQTCPCGGTERKVRCHRQPVDAIGISRWLPKVCRESMHVKLHVEPGRAWCFVLWSLLCVPPDSQIVLNSLQHGCRCCSFAYHRRIAAVLRGLLHALPRRSRLPRGPRHANAYASHLLQIVATVTQMSLSKAGALWGSKQRGPQKGS